jgi:hypothetical protein
VITFGSRLIQDKSSDSGVISFEEEPSKQDDKDGFNDLERSMLTLN